MLYEGEHGGARAVRHATDREMRGSLRYWQLLAVGLAALALLPLGASAAGSGAIEPAPGCDANTLDRNDDDSTSAVDLGFPLAFFGTTYSQVYVNNNGNVTFDGPLSDFTPFPLTTTNHVIIAPFFADVDTRGEGSAAVTYGQTTIDGHRAFCVDWAGVGVGYYNAHADKLNTFQLLLVDR